MLDKEIDFYLDRKINGVDIYNIVTRSNIDKKKRSITLSHFIITAKEVSIPVLARIIYHQFPFNSSFKSLTFQFVFPVLTKVI